MPGAFRHRILFQRVVAPDHSIPGTGGVGRGFNLHPSDCRNFLLHGRRSRVPMTRNRRPTIPDMAFWIEGLQRDGCRSAPDTIVAIPARDEAAHIGDCLDALAQQVDGDGDPLPPGSFGILLLLNNCRDETAAIAARRAPGMPFPLGIVEWELPPDHATAGTARRLAMDAAAGWLMAADTPGGAILTTDADSAVAEDWVFRHREAFDR